MNAQEKIIINEEEIQKVNQKARENIESITYCLKENEAGQKILVHKLKKVVEAKILYVFYIQDTDGQLSDPIYKAKSSLLAKSGFNWIIDYGFDFKDKTAETNEIGKGLESTEIKTILFQDGLSVGEIYLELCDKLEAFLQGNPAGHVEQVEKKDGYYYVNVATFNEIVSEHFVDYTKLKIKKILMQNGCLRANKDRYDYTRKDNDKNQYKVIAVKTLETMGVK